MSSPAWHRRARKLRSSARKRIRLGTSTALDRARIFRHHATPSDQKRVLMSWKGASSKSGGGKEQGGKHGGRWQYWHGSWSPSQKGAMQKGSHPPWRQGGGKNKEATGGSLVFPGYDAAGKDHVPITEVSSSKKEYGDSYAAALQRAINHVRKAEARTRKALGDRRARVTQWNNWVQELRRSYAKEKSRYKSALDRLERELEEAQVEQEETKATLRRVAASLEVGERMEVATDVGLEFDSLMEKVEDMIEEPQESNADILRRALQRPYVGESQVAGDARDLAPAQAVTPVRTHVEQRDMSTPLHGIKAGQEVTSLNAGMGTYVATPGQTPAIRDPYLASPSAVTRRAPTSATSRKTSITPEGSKREGIKAAGRPMAPFHGHTRSESLAEKLEQRRAKLGVAGTPSAEDGLQQMNVAPAPKTGVPERHIIFDDDDDHDLSETSDLENWYQQRYADGNKDLQTLE